jgi:hypothetical protein
LYRKRGAVGCLRCGYFRFLNSFVPSISVTYWKPASISEVASWMAVAVLQVHSSSLRFSSCARAETVWYFLTEFRNMGRWFLAEMKHSFNSVGVAC